MASTATIHAICSAKGVTPSRNRAQPSRADGDLRETMKPTTTSTTSASATSASSAYPVLMTPEDVTTAIGRGRPGQPHLALIVFSPCSMLWMVEEEHTDDG